MATIELKDGRVVPIVKPHIGDQIEVERELRAGDPKYTTADFKADLRLSGFQSAFALFATMRRNGLNVTFADMLAIDLGELGQIITPDPEPAPEEDGEGEQGTDPQSAGTVDAADSDPAPSPGPNSTD